MLEADGFAAFAEKGDVFDPELASRLKEIYSAGDTRDPIELYRAFRGREPSIAALLEQRGLAEPQPGEDGTAAISPRSRSILCARYDLACAL